MGCLAEDLAKHLAEHLAKCLANERLGKKKRLGKKMKTWRNKESLVNNMNAWREENTSNNFSNTVNEFEGISIFKRRHALFFKVVAFIVIIAFMTGDMARAQGGTPLWQNARPKAIESSLDKAEANGLSIPYSAGTAQEAYANGGEKVVINIQDAHSSLSAQESIVSLLDHLVANYDLSMIAVEGSAGYVDTSILKTFPDKNARRKAAEHLMKQGRMSAGEFFTIVTDAPIALYGVENDKLYKENVEAFKGVMTERARLVKNTEGLYKQLKTLEDKIYSKELKSFLEKSYQHREEGLAFSEYWKSVSALAEKKKVNIAKYENIAKLLASIDLEGEIFKDGYYKAFGIGSGPCYLCDECEEFCQHPREARPAMEACGIDVFTTVRAHGFPIETLKTKDQKGNYYGLVLIE